MVNMLTQQQENVLTAIKGYINENNVPPTMRELCDITGLKSTSSIYRYVKQLERAGHIGKRDKTARNIVLKV